MIKHPLPQYSIFLPHPLVHIRAPLPHIPVIMFRAYQLLSPTRLQKARHLMPELPSDGSYGPKMRALNRRQRVFVKILMEQKMRNYRLAAQEAGYDGDEMSLRATGSRLAHDEKIVEAVEEEYRKRLRLNQPIAIHILEEVMRCAEKDADKLKALQLMMTAGGALVQKTETKTTVEHVISDEAVIARMLANAQFLGIDVEKLLGKRLPELIDITPTPAVEYPKLEIEGLEGLI